MSPDNHKPSTPAPAERARDLELSALLDASFPAPELNVQKLQQRLAVQIQPVAAHKPNKPLLFFDHWFSGLLRPAMAAMLLIGTGFYIGFSQPGMIQPLLTNEETRFDTVSQLAFEDSSTNYYQTYSQAFLETDLLQDQAEPQEPGR